MSIVYFFIIVTILETEIKGTVNYYGQYFEEFWRGERSIIFFHETARRELRVDKPKIYKRSAFDVIFLHKLGKLRCFNTFRKHLL